LISVCLTQLFASTQAAREAAPEVQRKESKPAGGRICRCRLTWPRPAKPGRQASRLHRPPADAGQLKIAIERTYPHEQVVASWELT